MNIIIGEFFGYLAGSCMAICFLPQSIKTVKTRDVSNLSLSTYIIYIVGVISWISYGIYLKSFQMILFNLIQGSFAVLILYNIIKYKKLCI